MAGQHHAGEYRESNYTVELTDDGKLVWPLRSSTSGQRLMQSAQRNWSAMLIALAVDGDVEDKSGQAVRKFHGRYARHYKRLHGTKAPLAPTALTPPLVKMETLGLVKRDCNGKRTHRISLGIDAAMLPDEWFPVSEPEPAEAPEASEASADVPEATEPAQEASEAIAPLDYVELVERPAAWTIPLQLSLSLDDNALATALAAAIQSAVAQAVGAVSGQKDTDVHAALSLQLQNAQREQDKVRRALAVADDERTRQDGQLKALRVQLADEQRASKELHASLLKVTGALEQLRNNGVDEAHRRMIDQTMRAIPGDYRNRGDE